MALAECCISRLVARDTPRLIGAEVDLANVGQASSLSPGPSQTTGAQPDGQDARPAIRLDALLFGEAQGRIVISVAPHNAAKVLAQAKILEIPAAKLGVTGGSRLHIKTASGDLTWDLAELHDLWWNSIARAMS